MIINNKNKLSNTLAIDVIKGLNFSSLYQAAYFSSNNLQLANTIKESNSLLLRSLDSDSDNDNQHTHLESGSKYASTSLGVKAISSKAKNNNIDNILIKQGLGPIKNGFANKLLNYKFIGNNNLNNNINKNIATLSTEDIIKLISAFFKSIYCLISRPKFINTNDKIIIEILYYITIPDHNIFKWYNFIYSNNNKLANLTPKIVEREINKNKKKPGIKTILYKNYFLKKTLFKLNNSNIVNLYFNKFNILFKLLQVSGNNNNSLMNLQKPILFNLIRIHKSDYDSNILAQLFILILKKKNIRIAINKIFNKNNINSAIDNAKIAKANSITNTNKDFISDSNKNYAIPYLTKTTTIPMFINQYNSPLAYISGLYIKIGGRLMREPIIPRLTTKKFEVGAIATGKVNFVDSARITKKNKKGAFTIKITYAQNFN